MLFYPYTRRSPLQVTEYFTSFDFAPVKSIKNAGQTGPGKPRQHHRPRHSRRPSPSTHSPPPPPLPNSTSSTNRNPSPPTPATVSHRCDPGPWCWYAQHCASGLHPRPHYSRLSLHQGRKFTLWAGPRLGLRLTPTCAHLILSTRPHLNQTITGRVRCFNRRRWHARHPRHHPRHRRLRPGRR